MKSRLLLGSLLLLTLPFVGCANFQPEEESRRIAVANLNGCIIKGERPCTELERVSIVFDDMTVNRSTLADLRRRGFGPPQTVLETIPSPEIRSRLTKTTDGGMEMLDIAVRECIMHPDAAYRCQMVIFTDSYQRSRGANNPLARVTGINKIDIVSSWSWEAAFVLERSCTKCTGDDSEYVVKYKQFRHTEDPPTKRRKKLPILNSSAVDLNFKP